MDENWAKKQPKMTESLEVRKQESAVGKGLFVRKSFKKGFDAGDAIGEYVGERILEDEYQARVEKYIIEKQFNYFVGVNDGLYIDAAQKGNWTRFVNNSHEPNAQFEPCVVSGYWRVYLVATEKIRPGEEITIDYGTEYRCPDQKFVECFCSSKRCSGVIGVPLEKESISKLLLKDIHYQDDDLNILCAENRLLESKNRQLQKQISLIQPLILDRIKQSFDEVFIPVIDRRPQDVIESNGRVVHELMGQSLLAVDCSPNNSLNGDASTIAVSNGTSNTTLTASTSKQKAVTNGRRSSPRLSTSGKRGVEDEDEDSECESAQITPPPKKKRHSLTVQKISGHPIESSIPSPSQVLKSAPSSRATTPRKSHPVTESIQIIDDVSDDEIIEVSPSHTFRPVSVCALTGPKSTSPSLRNERLSKSPAKLKSASRSDHSEHGLQMVPFTGQGKETQKLEYVDKLVRWYQKVRNSGDFKAYSCPLHPMDSFHNMHEARRHFFITHYAAASKFRNELGSRGSSFNDNEQQMFEEGQKRRSTTTAC